MVSAAGAGVTGQFENILCALEPYVTMHHDLSGGIVAIVQTLCGLDLDLSGDQRFVSALPLLSFLQTVYATLRESAPQPLQIQLRVECTSAMAQVCRFARTGADASARRVWMNYARRHRALQT